MAKPKYENTIGNLIELLTEIKNKYGEDVPVSVNLYNDRVLALQSVCLDNDMEESEILKKKIKGQTAIPTGTYPVKITYSPKYKKNMPLIENVKGYSGIRIHSGNTHKDTEGCVLVGKNKEVGKVLESRKTYNALYKILSETKERIIIDIRRNYKI